MDQKPTIRKTRTTLTPLGSKVLGVLFGLMVAAAVILGGTSDKAQWAYEHSSPVSAN